MASDCKNLDSEEEAELEKQHFRRIISAFMSYKSNSMTKLHKSIADYASLPPPHQTLVSSYRQHLDDLIVCVDHNHHVLKAMVQCTEHMFENSHTDLNEESNDSPTNLDMDKLRTVLRQIMRDWSTEGADERLQCYGPESNDSPTNLDMDKLRTVLRQIMRDWSTEGGDERSQCYGPVVSYIQKYLPLTEDNGKKEEVSILIPGAGLGCLGKEEVSILIPGAGLGRLMYDLAALGYACQGNEWSLFMLVASNYILNHCTEANTLTIYPWVHSPCNNLSYSNQTRPVVFPDVYPGDLPSDHHFSMAAGDFLEIYTEPESWNAVVTVYFIDTAHNIISYVENIWRILKPGGYWVNHGPLLYHYTDIPSEASIDLCYDDLRKVILHTGFIFEVEKTDVQSTYTQNHTSMLQYMYHAVLFVVHKHI